MGKEKVNHPAHYNSGQYEVMDVIEDAGFGEDFCLGNALKYITRHRRKGDGAKDIHKAIHYLEMILEIEYGEK